MKPNSTRSLIFAAACGGLCLAFASGALAAAQEGAAAVQAERALNEALSKGNKAAVGRLLDAHFQWTDADGKTRTKAGTLRDVSALATVTREEREVQTHDFGQVERIVGRNQTERFVHLWVKRADGWQAFAFMDTPIPVRGYHQHPSPPRPKDKTCINPCKELPYKPANAAQRGAMDAWLATKMDEWHAVSEDWPKHVSDTMVVISPTMYFDKAGRLALLVAQQKAYGTGSHSAAVVSMHMYDFGNTVILTALHGPNAFGKRSRALRMFVKEDGVWKIALSDQTDIQPAGK